MKKTVCLILSLITSAFLLVSCGGKSDGHIDELSLSDKAQVSCVSAEDAQGAEKPRIDPYMLEGYWRGFFEGIDGVVCFSPTGNATLYHTEDGVPNQIYFTFSCRDGELAVNFINEEHIFSCELFEDYIVIDGQTLIKTDESAALPN